MVRASVPVRDREALPAGLEQAGSGLPEVPVGSPPVVFSLARRDGVMMGRMLHPHKMVGMVPQVRAVRRA